MARSKILLMCKIEKLIAKFPKELSCKYSTRLYCNACSIRIKTITGEAVKRHLNSKEHISKRNIKEEIEDKEKKQSALSRIIVEAFLEADIPLKKLRNPKISYMFSFIGYNVPSETTARRLASEINKVRIEELALKMQNKKLFIMLDSTKKSGIHYVNIIGGTVEQPEKQFLLETLITEENDNAERVISAIQLALDKIYCDFSNLSIVLSDAAPYNIKAKKLLKEKAPNIYFVTCHAHFLNNCASFIRNKCPKTDALIASVKNLRARTSKYEEFFIRIGKPPEVCLTRWNTWLKSAIYYYDKHTLILEYINTFPENPRSNKLKAVYEAIIDKSLVQELDNIFNNYNILIAMLVEAEHHTFSIKDAYKQFNSFKFGQDPFNLINYCNKRWEANEIVKLMEIDKKIYSTEIFNLLQNCPATTVAVERSFSMLNKLLAKDRQFKKDNIPMYIGCYFKNKY